MENRSTLYAIAAALALGVCTLGFTFLGSTTNDPVQERVVVSYEPVIEGREESIIEYEYIGEPLPERLVPDEVVEKRTENSYTRNIGVENEGTPHEKMVYQVVIYEEDIYVKQGGRWYMREQATTTETAFFEAKPLRRMARMVSTAVAYAASYSGFSTSADGHRTADADGDFELGVATFDDCVGGAGGPGGGGVTDDLTSTTAFVGSAYSTTGFDSCDIWRGILTFDTTSVPVGATVSAASLQLFITAKTNTDDDGLDILSVEQYSATWTSWGTAGGSNTLDITSVTTSAYNTLTLNATGFTYLTLGGTTTLGVREGHDKSPDSPAANTTDTVTFSTSEEASTTQDPTLSITYTGGGFSFWQFQDF